MTTYSLREIQPSDSPALSHLMGDDPETPGMSMTTRFLVDTYQAWRALKPDLAGVVAEAPGFEGLAGAATVSFEEIRFEGRMLPSAFLENLKVHHAHRGQGLGTQLARWRADKARERLGADSVILTGTSTDNTASINTMKKWCKQFFSPLAVAIRPMRRSPPEPLPGITVRPAEARGLPEIAEKSNRFYADYNLYPPLSPEKLATLLNGTFNVYHYRVAVDGRGNIVAGVMLSERGKLMVEEFRNVPLPLRLMNTVMRLIPDDNRLRLLEAGFLWFDQLPAAQYLWEHVRWDFRQQASSISAPHDPRSPLKDVFQIKPWHVPKVKLILAINGPVMMDNGKLVCGSLRG